MGNEAPILYKPLASLLSQKWDFPYSTNLCWLRCCLSYSLLRSSIQAIRGARSSQGHAVRLPTAIDLVTIESNITENNQGPILLHQNFYHHKLSKAFVLFFFLLHPFVLLSQAVNQAQHTLHCILLWAGRQWCLRSHYIWEMESHPLHRRVHALHWKCYHITFWKADGMVSRARASWKADLCSVKLCSVRGRTASQVEAPFTLAKSTAFWSLSSNCW